MRGNPESEIQNPNLEMGKRPPGAGIHFHIERLVLDGFALSGRDAALFQAAMETELARLFRAGDGVDGRFEPIALASVPAAKMDWAGNASADESGRRAAAALFNSLPAGAALEHVDECPTGRGGAA